MYTKTIPYKNFRDEPRNAQVQFNLTEREVFKLLKELQAVFAWQESIKGGDQRNLDTDEVIEFYNNFEEILLSAWGEMSADGEHFRKQGRYEFEDSALFAGAMVLFVTDPQETYKLIDGLMPSDMQELVKKADANMVEMSNNPDNPEELQAEIQRLRRQLSENSGVPSDANPS